MTHIKSLKLKVIYACVLTTEKELILKKNKIFPSQEGTKRVKMELRGTKALNCNFGENSYEH